MLELVLLDYLWQQQGNAGKEEKERGWGDGFKRLNLVIASLKRISSNATFMTGP